MEGSLINTSSDKLQLLVTNILELILKSGSKLDYTNNSISGDCEMHTDGLIDRSKKNWI